MELRRMRIGVLLGGMSEERPISLLTGAAIAGTLRAEGYETVEIDVDERVAERIREENVGVAVLALHGKYGEDGTIQGLLEMMKIPYTGSGVLGSALAMDKIVSKELFLFHGIPTPAYFTVSSVPRAGDEHIPCGFGFPLVVKPSASGSSIGVSIARDRDSFREAVREARRYGYEVLVEEFIPGKLITVGMIDGEGLPIIEIRPKSGVYDYKAKYTKGETEYVLPAELDEPTAEMCARLSQQVRRVLRCRGVCRSDAIVDSRNRVFFLELNTLPGLTETSLIPKAAAHAGISFAALLERMLRLAVEGRG